MLSYWKKKESRRLIYFDMAVFNAVISLFSICTLSPMPKPHRLLESQPQINGMIARPWSDPKYISVRLRNDIPLIRGSYWGDRLDKGHGRSRWEFGPIHPLLFDVGISSCRINDDPHVTYTVCIEIIFSLSIVQFNFFPRQIGWTVVYMTDKSHFDCSLFL